MRLKIADKLDGQYDLASLGEVMLRFDPGEHRIRHARSFQVWEGGGEYNVARGLSSCFGKRTAIVTALVDNEIGRLVQNRIREGGVDDRWIRWAADDGIGAAARNGCYYWERGFGVRSSAGASDRAHTAISQMAPGEIDWTALFAERGVRWFHTGGIFAGLSEGTTQVCSEAMQAARAHGAVVSYDLNYRASVWQRRGGRAEANRVNNRLLSHADVLFGIAELRKSPATLDDTPFREAILETVNRHPQLSAVATTMRVVHNTDSHDWSGLLWMDGCFYRGMAIPALRILDRVGGGDAFASGLISGLLDGMPPEETIDRAVAHGALAMTTPGDNSMATEADVAAMVNTRGPGFNR